MLLRNLSGLLRPEPSLSYFRAYSSGTLAAFFILKPGANWGWNYRRLCDMVGIRLADDTRIFETLNGDPPPEVRTCTSISS